MPKCVMCNRDFPNKRDLTLVRDDAGRWVVECKKCAGGGKGKDAQAPSPPSPVETEHDKFSSKPTPGRIRRTNVAQWQRLRKPKGVRERKIKETEKAFEKIQQTLDLLAKELDEQTPRSHERTHKRHSANLQIEFNLVRDDNRHKGRIRDISQSGLRFITDTELDIGQVIRMKVTAPEGKAVEALIKSAAEVRRVHEVNSGRYEIGVRFVRNVRANDPNRRVYRRHRANLAVYYRRTGCEYTAKGRVRDISQGGARLILDEEMEVGEELAVVMRGESGAFLKADLKGIVCVKRSTTRHSGECEVGCHFVRMTTKPRRR